MKILFLLLSMPDLDYSSNLYSDLVEEFVKQGHEVFPVASWKKKEKTRIHREKGIDVLRVKTLKLFNVGPIQKGIANMLLPYQYRKAIKKYYKGIEFDLVIMPTPPITLCEVANRIKRRNKARFYLILRDIFPQNAVDLEMMKKEGILYRYFRAQEKKLYRYADAIGCMSQGNIDYIHRHNPEVNQQKLHILMNFQKSSSPVVGLQTDMKEKYGLQGKLVVVFGGNMGIPQKLENVIALAKSCQEEYADVVFLLIGNGTQRREIEKMADRNGVKNIVFQDLISRDDYQQLVGQCDIGLISLNEKFTIPNIPSKTMAYYDVGIPVLASVDTNTDYGRMLEDSETGLYSLAGDIKAFKANFDKLYRDPELRERMGKNGKRFLEEKMSPELAYKTIMDHV